MKQYPPTPVFKPANAKATHGGHEVEHAFCIRTGRTGSIVSVVRKDSKALAEEARAEYILNQRGTT